MFKKENKNEIDMLVAKIEKLKVEKERVEDDKNRENSKLENICSKHDVITKALRDKAQRNDKICENMKAEIDREIERLEGQIKLANEINHKRVEDFTKPVTTSVTCKKGVK